MIYHASIPADEPERVARVMAELWRGEYFPFLDPGTFIVLTGDERGTEVEIIQRRFEMLPAETQVTVQVNPSPSPYCSVHLNIATACRRKKHWQSPPARVGPRASATEVATSSWSSSGLRTNSYV